MSYDTIITENINSVLLITLNRPERLNAWTYQMGAELRRAIEAARNPAVSSNTSSGQTMIASSTSQTRGALSGENARSRRCSSGYAPITAS